MSSDQEKVDTDNGSPRMWAMADRELDHRIWIGRQSIYLRWAGLTSAFTITMAFLIASYQLIQSGHSVAGTVLATVDLVALASTFLVGVTKSGPAPSPGDRPTPEGSAA